LKTWPFSAEESKKWEGTLQEANNNNMSLKWWTGAELHLEARRLV
jgi:hypothetical protein